MVTFNYVNVCATKSSQFIVFFSENWQHFHLIIYLIYLIDLRNKNRLSIFIREELKAYTESSYVNGFSHSCVTFLLLLEYKKYSVLRNN